jgi:hypothetical protein
MSAAPGALSGEQAGAGQVAAAPACAQRSAQ